MKLRFFLLLLLPVSTTAQQWSYGRGAGYAQFSFGRILDVQDDLYGYLGIGSTQIFMANRKAVGFDLCYTGGKRLGASIVVTDLSDRSIHPEFRLGLRAALQREHRYALTSYSPSSMKADGYEQDLLFDQSLKGSIGIRFGKPSSVPYLRLALQLERTFSQQFIGFEIALGLQSFQKKRVAPDSALTQDLQPARSHQHIFAEVSSAVTSPWRLGYSYESRPINDWLRWTVAGCVGTAAVTCDTTSYIVNTSSPSNPTGWHYHTRYTCRGFALSGAASAGLLFGKSQARALVAVGGNILHFHPAHYERFQLVQDDWFMMGAITGELGIRITSHDDRLLFGLSARENMYPDHPGSDLGVERQVQGILLLGMRF